MQSPARLDGLRLRDEGVVVGALDEEGTRDDHDEDDGHLDGDDERGDPCRQLHAEHEDGGEHQHQGGGEDVEAEALGAVPSAQLGGDVPAGVVQQRADVARPADGHHRRAERELQDQVPADDPGGQFAQGGVGEGVRGAGHRDGGGELGVAQRGERADDSGDDEREGDGGSRVVLGDGAGQYEDAGADDDADAEDGQVQCRQGFLERVLRFLRVTDGLLDLLGPEEGVAHGDLPRLSSST